MPLIIALLIMVVLYLIQRKTVIGKYNYEVGVNERAAHMAGADVTRTKMTAFAVCGTLSGISGILLATKLNSGIPTVGEPITLMAIATAALGGISLSGGKGTVLSALLGAALVIVIQNGMNLIAVNTYWQQIVFGALVIGALYLTVEKSGRGVTVK
jgi:ribose/xylose/arabinose/galactoside ABC-type transport system permease subunit